MVEKIDEFIASYKRYTEGEPFEVPHVIAGVERYDGAQLSRENPAYPDKVASIFHDAPGSLAAEAVAASRAAQQEWRAVPLADRIGRVRRAIPELERRSSEFAVRIAVETGKTYAQCISEVDEVVTFLRRYTEYAELDGAFEESYPAPTDDVSGLTALKPYGVFAVITPFNYPFALAGGPVIGALLAGNGAVIKSASRGPWSGYSVYEITTWMDLPAGLVSVVHGASEISRAVVDSDVDGIAFTGSVNVGMSIVRKVAEGAFVRPVIAEMGGKNPLIVSDGADLEAAASGIMFSGYDLAGQKCSCLSRILVTPGLTDDLVNVLTPLIKSFTIGPPDRAEAAAGPVVSPQAVADYARIIETAQAEGFTVIAGDAPDDGGYFVPPTLIVGVPHDHWLSTTEHFLPVVTVSELPSFEEALIEANSPDTGLTAGLVTGEKQHAAQFLDQMHAGGLNVNIRGHATTGWWPGLSTFGGWKASGSTGKQGYGKSYVQQFARQQSSKLPAELRELLTY